MLPPKGRRRMSQELAIRLFDDGEPRVLDLELAERLGFERPRNIRQLIERNLEELERYGRCCTVQRRPEEGGHEVTEYWPNEQQALLVCIMSKTPRAADVRQEIIQVFTAYRHGRIIPNVPTLAEIGSMFEEKLEPVHERMTRIEDNVVYLGNRMDSWAPRHNFNKETIAQWLAVIHSEHYNNYCPCCRKTKIVNEKGDKTSELHNDHFRGRERNGFDEGWPVCAKCNIRLKHDAAFKEDKRAHFRVFHDIRREMFNGHAPKSRKPRSQLDPRLPGI